VGARKSGHNRKEQSMPAENPRAPSSSRFRTLLLAALGLTLTACTFSSTASRWHRRIGPNGKPVYVKSHTNVGFNLGTIIPLLGATSLPSEIDYLTEEIAMEKGDTVRIIESATENYWYGFPPFTWIITPVITTVTADYEPAADILAKDLAEQDKERAATETKDEPKK
jgi:hypothetical protein